MSLCYEHRKCPIPVPGRKPPAVLFHADKILFGAAGDDGKAVVLIQRAHEYDIPAAVVDIAVGKAVLLIVGIVGKGIVPVLCKGISFQYGVVGVIPPAHTVARVPFRTVRPGLIAVEEYAVIGIVLPFKIRIHPFYDYLLTGDDVNGEHIPLLFHV